LCLSFDILKAQTTIKNAVTKTNQNRGNINSNGTIMKGNITDISKIRKRTSRGLFSTDIQIQYGLAETLIVFGRTMLSHG
jgi:hypothetical protein